jgi:hypothetical protein
MVCLAITVPISANVQVVCVPFQLGKPSIHRLHRLLQRGLAAAALALSVSPDLTPDQFQSLLMQTAEDLGDDGYDTNYGWGLLRVDNLLAALQNYWVDTSGAAQLSLWRSGMESEQTVLVTVASYSEAGRLLGITMTQATTSTSGMLTATLHIIQRTQAHHVQIMILDPRTWIPLTTASTQLIASTP